MEVHSFAHVSFDLTRSLLFPPQNPVSDAYSVLWFVFQPLLFGLIGTEIRIDALRADTVALGLLVLAIGEGTGTGGGRSG